MTTKLAFLSDSPAGNTGLGRIHRDLAAKFYGDSVFAGWEMATIGYRGNYSQKLPWTHQYTVNTPEPSLEWYNVLSDFAQDDELFVVPICPPSWIFGLANPDLTAQENPQMRKFTDFVKAQVKLCPYLAIESLGVGRKFGAPFRSVIENSHKVLFYSKFGADAAKLTTGKEYPYVHHGFDSVGFSRPSTDVVFKTRKALRVPLDHYLIGCVMTNQWRKDYGLLAQICKVLVEQNFPFALWIHTDKIIGHWNLFQLIEDFELQASITITATGEFTDAQLAAHYAACDVTVLPSRGEGFGYPVMESMAAGTPCVTGDWGGQAELSPSREFVVLNDGLYPEGVHGLLRPFYNPYEWAEKIRIATLRRADNSSKYSDSSFLVEHAAKWSWEKQWPKFRKWLLTLPQTMV